MKLVLTVGLGSKQAAQIGLGRGPVDEPDASRGILFAKRSALNLSAVEQLIPSGPAQTSEPPTWRWKSSPVVGVCADFSRRTGVLLIGFCARLLGDLN